MAQASNTSADVGVAPETNNTSAVVDQYFAPYRAAQAASAAAAASSLKFFVSLGLLAFGLVRHNTYVAIIGGGSLAYFALKGEL